MKKFIYKLMISLIITVFALQCFGCVNKVISAYDVAVKNGFEGSEQEWLLSLQGQNGLNGKDGENCQITIEQLYESAVNNGYSGTMLDFIEQYLGSQSIVNDDKQQLSKINQCVLSAVKVVSFLGDEIDNRKTSSGAGVIYKLDKTTGDAIIITNYHVVYDNTTLSANKICKNIKVFLYGHEFYFTDLDYSINATFIGGSMTYDLAVLKVTASEILKNSQAQQVSIDKNNDLVVGSKVFAVGNPEGDGLSVTQGIISVDSEYVNMKGADDKTYFDFRFMRTDCAVNRGNSGGGLFNSNGDLIGIVSAKVINSNVENIGYAIPSSLVVGVVENLIWNCSNGINKGVYKGFLGITVSTKSSKAYYDPNTLTTKIIEEINVTEVDPTSVVYGKIQKDDILLSLKINDGEVVNATRRFIFIDHLLYAKPNDDVTITYKRGEQVDEITIKLGVENFKNII